ncbi:biotin transporter BioY [Rhodococcus sp. SGAir0479]|uniref:biotin transporter BioY n=1 Tax=Rhodococcus sp. SGAir0479 TaxID=2567884 RepID=UPI0010CCCC59|nr:biotin transporter BioY [Rhodococcus sp. SGAir0479]QCQ90763.1 biotin transporter BioY [Rhodococcus sp. SGAir0479]
MSPTSPTGTPRNTARDLAQIAVFAALIIALGLPGTITIGGSGVPITLQALGVMLAGALLGPRKGTLAVLTVIVLGLALPVLAGGRTSLMSLSSPTAGFLIGWLPAAAVIGWLSYRMLPRYNTVAGVAINLLGGVVVLYAFGLGGMLLRTDMTLAAAFAANATFLPGDAVKAVVAAVVAAQVHRAYPALAAPRVPTAPVRVDTADAA